VRQSLSSACCAAGDSPCASKTTLQWVVVKAIAPTDAGPVALSEVTSSGAALTPVITVRSRAESKPAYLPRGRTAAAFAEATAGQVGSPERFRGWEAVAP
jgi:hypothetical protein